MNYFLPLFLAVSISCLSQNDQQTEVINSFIEGFNIKDYKAIKKNWDPIGKILVSRKKLRAQYGNFFEENGRASVVDIVHNFGSVYTADVVFEERKSAHRHVYFQFNFNENNKVNGFGYGFPTFNYAKKSATGSYDEKKLLKIVESYREKNGAPFHGSVYLTQNGKDLVSYNNGYTDNVSNRKIDSETRYLLASCSKIYTALAVMTLADAGKLSTDSLVTTYLPDFPYKNVRVRNLLSHTSGIPDYQRYLSKYLSGRGRLTNEQVISMYAEHSIPLGFQPETYFQYSNINYIILSTLVEKISGQTTGDYLSKHVTEPLGIPGTRVYTTRRQGEKLDNFAVGFVWDEATGSYKETDSLKEFQFVAQQDGLTGDDNVCSSVKDMNRFLGIFEQQSLLSEKSMQQTCSPYILANGEVSNYGFGLGIQKDPEIFTVYTHSGSWPGYLTCFFSIPEKNIRLVILSNYSNDQVQLMANDLLQVILE